MDNIISVFRLPDIELSCEVMGIVLWNWSYEKIGGELDEQMHGFNIHGRFGEGCPRKKMMVTLRIWGEECIYFYYVAVYSFELFLHFY
jgi:hypothetical protein